MKLTRKMSTRKWPHGRRWIENSGLLFALLALVLLGVMGDTARADEVDGEGLVSQEQVSQEQVSQEQARICLVCTTPTGADGPVALHRGREIYLHLGACEEHWLADPALYFASLQPAGALFQEAQHVEAAVRGQWFWVSIYVVLGLFSSAASAYLAVNRGHPPAVWFFAGLFGNLAALVVIAFVIPKQSGMLTPAGIPAGLTKVPITYAPRACTGCDATIHPSADSCASCGAKFEPLVASEVITAGRANPHLR